MSDLQILDPITYSGWDELLLSTPGSSFFHTSSWARVLKETYGYEPNYFTIIDQGRMLALIPFMEVNSFLTGKRGVSLPFTDYCEPIIEKDKDFADLFNSLIEYGKSRGWKYVEIRGGDRYLIPHSAIPARPAGGRNPQSEGPQPETWSIIPSLTYLGHTLNLSDKEDQIFSSFRDSTRRNIKKAVKEGVEVKIDHSLESVKEFCRLNCLTRKEHGLPPQPFGFFEKIHDHVISKGLGMVVLAFLNQENIAGAIYFHFDKKAVFKYGASDNKYQHLRANNLVMWEAMRWYSKNGYESLCFGRTEPENQGLVQFKSGWGTTEQPIHYYRYDIRKSSFVSGSSRVTGFHNKIFRNTPVPIFNRIGNIFYRHVG